jgi:Tfp pilus assembly protein PilF
MQHAEAGKYSKRHLNQAFDIAEKEGDHEAMEKYNQHLKREYPRTEQDDASYQNRILKAKQS